MEVTPMEQRAKKYRELDSIQRANYWALMNLVSTFRDVLGDDHPDRIQFVKSVSILETNLNIELFTDEEEN